MSVVGYFVVWCCVVCCDDLWFVFVGFVFGFLGCELVCEVLCVLLMLGDLCDYCLGSGCCCDYC